MVKVISRKTDENFTQGFKNNKILILKYQPLVSVIYFCLSILVIFNWKIF